MKARTCAGRAYFIPSEPDPILMAMDVLTLIPAVASEGRKFVVLIADDDPVTTVIWDSDLLILWHRERRKLEQDGHLSPLLPVPGSDQRRAGGPSCKKGNPGSRRSPDPGQSVRTLYSKKPAANFIEVPVFSGKSACAFSISPHCHHGGSCKARPLQKRLYEPRRAGIANRHGLSRKPMLILERLNHSTAPFSGSEAKALYERITGFPEILAASALYNPMRGKAANVINGCA